MWLHPGPGISVDRVGEATTQINPLLQRVFRVLFARCSFRDSFTRVSGSASAFMDMWFAKSPRARQMLKHPNASWRRMIPCSPAPDQLLVNVLDEERGKLLWLNFSNRNTQGQSQGQDMRPSHPPWLTFGLLYDITECAWHQANPWRLHAVKFDLPSASLRRRLSEDFVPTKAIISDLPRALAKSRAGRVRLHLEPDTRSEAERQEAYEVGVEGRRRIQQQKGWCGTKPLLYRKIFTDALHFEDALSLDEIEWDEVHEYDMPRC